jgi:hypothetical protein
VVDLRHLDDLYSALFINNHSKQKKEIRIKEEFEKYLP